MSSHVEPTPAAADDIETSQVCLDTPPCPNYNTPDCHAAGLLDELRVQDARLRRSEARANEVLHAAPVAMLVVDARGRILQTNIYAEELFGYSPKAMTGMSVENLIPVRFRAAHAGHRLRHMNDALPCRVMGAGGAYFGVRSDGEEFPLEVGLGRLEQDGEPCMVVSINDLSERQSAEAELRIAAIAFESQAGMLVTDPHGSIIRVNRAFTRLTGYQEDEVIGQTPALLRSGRHGPDFYECMWAELKQQGYWQGEIWNRRKNGKVYAEWLNITAVSAANGEITHYVGTFSDITVNKEAEAEIHRLAYYDPLTHLPNRHLLQDRLGQALAGSARSGRYAALLFLDLDNFKTLNDTRGHVVGDQLLIEVARRLHSLVREGDTVSRLGEEDAGSRSGDTVSRLGGDEFVVVLEDLSHEPGEASIQARVVGEKLCEVLAYPYELDFTEHFCSASLGITIFRGHDQPVDSLLKQADMALYQAKAAGRNTLRFFDPAMQAVLDERSALEAALRKALQRGQLHLHYQAQLDSAQRVIGAEVLLRWDHPQRGTIPPSDFIPLAEDTGLIVPIGHWVLATTCAQIKAWSANPAACHLHLAVNVSSCQFRQPGFVDEVRQLLAETGADPSLLKIELTESMVIDNVASTIARMHELKALGVGFSMDDFGTGYSSLSYLKLLPLDQLKIDRSFVDDIANDPNEAAIVQTIISMGRILGLHVIAEGVETEAQRQFLESHGCHAYQGFLYSKPLPLREFETRFAHAP